MDHMRLFEKCHLCPRDCGINRLLDGDQGTSGFCRENHRLRVAYVGPHFGEEPPISGRYGSGTVFFSGCSLKCSYCQNYQISRDGIGNIMGMNALLEKIIGMIREKKVHNINFVTPDHYFPHTFRLVTRLRQKGIRLPIVYNLSGYQSTAMLRMARDYADVYLPDFKYADPDLSMALSKCRDYAHVALEAIVEMVRQKGFLDTTDSGAVPAGKGVLVRHLILPGKVENSLTVLDSLFLEFGPRLPLSLMSQYHPVIPQKDTDLDRFLIREEFDRVYAHARDLGFEDLFVQFPDDETLPLPGNRPFLPDFEKDDAFLVTSQ